MPEPLAVHCSSCGRVIGKTYNTAAPGALLCMDSICEYQGAPVSGVQRNAFITLLLSRGKAVSELATEYGLSRQRVYQVRNNWKAGV